jgi:hypothetical protein
MHSWSVVHVCDADLSDLGVVVADLTAEDSELVRGLIGGALTSSA